MAKRAVQRGRSPTFNDEAFRFSAPVIWKGLPFGVVSARNMHAPRWLGAPARLLLDATRAIHALVFGLLLVGIIGLGPMAASWR